MKICKIYLLTNNINGKIYVGQSWLDLNQRMGKNGSGYSNSPYIFNAIQKYGVENFSYSTLDECYDQETADELEEFYINELDSRNPEIGYNLKGGGSRGKHSEESKNKISLTQQIKAEAMTEEEKRIKAAPIMGWWKDKERGPQSEEKKQANSKFFKEWHANNVHPMQGKHHIEEAKRKISVASKGRPVSKEQREAIGKAHQMPIEKEQAILEVYLSGEFTFDEITEKFQCGRSAVYRILERNNIDRVPRGAQAKILSDDVKKEVVDKYLAGKKIQEIADEYERGYATIRRIIRKAGH